MPPKKVHESYLFILDLFTEEIKLEDVKKTFYKILLKFAQDKSRNKSKDVYKIILVGTAESNNVNKFKNITVFQDWGFFDQQDVFDTVIPVLERIDRGEHRGDVYEGLELGCEHSLNDELVERYTPKNIIIFSDLLFQPPDHVSKDSLKLSLDDIWLYVLGANVKVPTLKTIENIKTWSENMEAASDNINLTKNINIMKRIKNNGLMADLQLGSQLVFSYLPTKKAPYPWYCELKIGQHISMKANVLKLVDASHDFKFPKVTNTSDEYDEKSHKQHFNPDSGEVVEDPIRAYKFKGKYAFLTEEQEKFLEKKYNEDKCFELKYFVNYDDVVSPLYFEENHLSAVVADVRESENWRKPLKVVAEAMHLKKVAAVIKKIHCKGYKYRETPYLMFTCPDHGCDCLLLAKIPFSHEFKEDIDFFKPQLGRALSKTDDDAKNDEILEEHLDKYLSAITITESNDTKNNYYLHSSFLLQNPNLFSQIDHVIQSLLVDNSMLYDRNVVEFEYSDIFDNKTVDASFQALEETNLLPKAPSSTMKMPKTKFEKNY